MESSLIAEGWLYQALKNDVTLAGWAEGVYVDEVPEGTGQYVLITNLDAFDVSYVGGHIGHSDLLYTVRAVAEVGSYFALRIPAGRIHDLLHLQSGTIAIGTVLTCYRVQPFRMIERLNDRVFRHLGGIYRLQVQE